MTLAAAVFAFFSAFPVQAFAQTDVLVLNPKLFTENVHEPAIQPYQASVSLDFGQTPGTEGSTFKTVLLPPGKRLVIEYVSAGILLNGTQTDNFLARVSVATTFNNQTVTHFFVPMLRGKDFDSQFTGYSVGQVTRLYTDNKYVVTAIPNHLPNNGVAGVSISGYLVNIGANRAGDEIGPIGPLKQ